MRSIVIVACIGAAFSCLDTVPASGRIWRVTVDGTGDVPTIQAAVDTAEAGDEIVVAPGVYTWANQGTGTEFGLITFLRYVGGFTLRSEAGAGSTVLNAQGQGRVFYLMAYNEVTIEGFTITGGEAPLFGNFGGGGIIAHLCPAVFRDCVIWRNSARFGGGMWCGGVSNMQFIRCEFSQNNAEYGAGIYFINSFNSPYFYDCVIQDNAASARGGGVHAYNNILTFENTIFARNTAGTLGGALYESQVDASTMTNCTLTGNGANQSGGGVYLFGGSILTMDRSIVAFTIDGEALFVDGLSTLNIGCTDVYGPGGGIPAGAIDNGGNFSADPLFCSQMFPFDYHLEGGSPCTPGNHPDGADCGMIGALPADCGGVSVETRTWGHIKAIYHD